MIGFDAEEVTPAHEAWYAVVGARPVGSGPPSDEELAGLDDALPIFEAAVEWAWDHEDPRARHAAASAVGDLFEYKTVVALEAAEWPWRELAAEAIDLGLSSGTSLGMRAAFHAIRADLYVEWAYHGTVDADGTWLARTVQRATTAHESAAVHVEAAVHLARAQVLADHGEVERADREVVTAIRLLDGHEDPQAAFLGYEAWDLVEDLVEEHPDLAGADRALDAGIEKSARAVRADDPALWFSSTIEAGTTLGSELIRVGRTGEAETVLRNGVDLALRNPGYVELDAGFGCASRLERLAKETGDEDLLDEARGLAREVIGVAEAEGYNDLAAELSNSYHGQAG